MKQLSWFKFCPSKWAMGRTRKLSPEQRDEYLDLCCAYWVSECQMNEDTMRENTDLYDFFESKGLVCDDGITWLNEQYDKLNDTREKRRQAGAKGGKANAKQMLKQKEANAKQTSSKKKQIDRRDKIEERDRKIEGVMFAVEGLEFLEMWKQWKEDKAKEHNFKYKSVQSEQAALNKLSNMSGGLESTAVKIILQSLENGWKGFFGLKNEKTVNNGIGEISEEWLNAR